MMRKSLLLASLGAFLPMYMSDVAAAAVSAPETAPQPSEAKPEVAADVIAAAVASAPVTDTGNASGSPATDAAAASTSTDASAGEPGNAAAPAAGALTSGLIEGGQSAVLAATGGDAPNAGATPAAPVSVAEPASSAQSASSAAGASSNGASSGDDLPLYARVARHLEEIFRLTKYHADAPQKTMAEQTAATKEHIGGILHRLYNGMQVTEGEVVASLSQLYNML
jgi:hypothetical protein